MEVRLKKCDETYDLRLENRDWNNGLELELRLELKLRITTILVDYDSELDTQI